MDINAKIKTILEQAKHFLPPDAQDDKDGANIPIEDFRRYKEKIIELVNDSLPWWAKL